MTDLTPAIRPTEETAERFRQTQETAVAAVEAHARAAIESRYLIAIRRPRDLDETRAELMKECDRPGFADAALYNKPIGKGVEGLSIRFAEAAIKAMRNIYVESPAIFDSDKLRIVRVSVTDLESNVSYTKDVTIRKEVERKKLRRGQDPIAERVNSWGDTIYIVDATDDDILNKEGALISKAMRTQALRLVPGWLQEECEERVKATMRKRDAENPDAAKHRIADGFASLGVKPQHLKEYLGHELGECSPTELVELRALWQTINDGEATWREAMDFKHGGDTEAGSATDKLKERLKDGKKKAGKKAAKKTLSKETMDAEVVTVKPEDQNPEFSLEEWHQLLGECTTTQAVTDAAAVLDKAHDDQLISREGYNQGLAAMHVRSELNASGGKGKK